MIVYTYTENELVRHVALFPTCSMTVLAVQSAAGISFTNGSTFFLSDVFSTAFRIERVEMLDDVEISQQLFDHYCILYAVTDERQFPWSHISEPLAQIP